MLRPVLALALTLACLAGGPGDLLALQQSPFPAPSGPYSVGRTHFDWVDSSRVDLENRHGHRELVVWVWYPASPRRDAKQAAWLPGVWGAMNVGWENRLARLSARPGSIIREPTTTEMPLVHSFADAPPVTDQNKHPLLVFAAGWGVLPLKYSNLIEELVSHGYIVAGVVFTYYSPYAVFSDGDVAGQHEFAIDLPGAPPRYYRGPVPPPVIRVKTDDLRFTLNQLERVNADANSPLRGRFDLDRVGLLGHSSGGAVALQAANEDPRVRAVASFDGNLANFNDNPVLRKPLLWISAGLSGSGAVTPDNRGSLLTTVLRSAPVAYNVIIAGTTHFFSGDDGLRDGARPPGRADPVRALKVTKDYTRAFFDEQLLGKTSSLLNAGARDYPDATLDIVKRTTRTR
jgi:predicted dienelactone hydrolase